MISVIETTWDYSANTPEIDYLAEKMTENSIIDPALYGKYDVKRGLRDLDGKWSHVGEFDFSEADDGQDREIIFTFDPAVSFDAVTILADREGTDFGVSYGFLFYDAQVRVD